MVKLFCAVVRYGSVFPVDIDIGDTVGDLKDKIKEKKSGLICFDADLLKLYLARDGDKWLNSRDAEIKPVKRGEVPDRIKNLIQKELLLDEAATLDDEEYFSSNFTPGKRDIHVLVELPEDVGGVRDDSRWARMEQKIDRLYDKSTTEVYRLSRMSSAAGWELREQLNILLVNVKTVPFHVGAARPVDPFGWESVATKLGQDVNLTGEQHRKPYLEYMERNIGDVLSKQNLCVLGVEHQNIFNVKIPGHNIKLSGRTDLLILSDDVKTYPHKLEELLDVRMLVEIKQEVKGGASSQTISELIALDLMTDAPVMALLTDLKKTWQFFWVSEKTNDSIILYTALLKTPGDGFEVIRTLLQQHSSVDTDIEFACFDRPIKRRKLVRMLPKVSEGGGDVDIRDAIERYYDIASMLGPDIQMARAVANQITQAIPAFRSATSNLSVFS